MLDKFLVLLERFVVAHELIAANSAKPDAAISQIVSGPAANEEAAEPEQKAPAKRTRTAKPKAAPEPEPEQEEEEEAPQPKAKAKAKSEPDLDTLRDEIKDAAFKISAEGSDKCCDEFEDLLADYKVKNVRGLKDEDIEDFHSDLEELAAKYFELED